MFTSESVDTRKKIVQLLGALCFAGIILISRLFYLQVTQSSSYVSRGERNFLRMELINASRGNVLDWQGNLLATNRPVFDLYWEGTGNATLSARQREYVAKVTEILGPNNALDTQLIRAEKFGHRCKIAEDISLEQLSQISEQCSDFANLVIVHNFCRTYPYNNLACHILGYLGRMEASKAVGRSGLEKLLQNELQGKEGYAIHVTNSTGKKLSQIDYKEAQPGADLSLTLDLTMQRIAETLFSPKQAGVFIVMDPQDGAIRALVSYPTFNPNDFLMPISSQDWQTKFAERNPLLNRAISALYPPASIFKLVTFAAGLEEGIIKRDTTFHCKGYTEFYGRKYHCQRRWGHGAIDCKNALAFSCNIPCYEIAKKIKIDQLASYAFKFGLGYRTDFVLSDKDGLVPTTAWKSMVKGESWWQGETLSSCIGQGYFLVTPLQIARMIGGVATGNLVKPRILQSDPIEYEPLAIKPETLAFLRESMAETVRHGTAVYLRNLKDFTIFAKSGTAQTSSLAKAKEKQMLEHVWFVSYFQYKDEKPLVLVALVESVGTTKPAQMITRRFLKAYAALRAHRA